MPCTRSASRSAGLSGGSPGASGRPATRRRGAGPTWRMARVGPSGGDWAPSVRTGICWVGGTGSAWWGRGAAGGPGPPPPSRGV
ncbi:hypothetical protein HBB16_12810 [Pseudonocardia sp. MCCB 268]|nr:hypothetical protein [Pseudonocardia cytotoxica]